MLLLTSVVFEDCLTAHRTLGKGEESVMDSTVLQFPKKTDSMVIKETIPVLLSKSNTTREMHIYG